MGLFLSSIVYLFTFLLTLCFCYFGEQQINKKTYKSRYIAAICFFMVILLPSLLAGIRANSVGIDVMVYVVPYFEGAKYVDSISALSTIYGGEYWYSALVYIVSRITDNVGILLFILQFLVIAPILKALLNLKEKVSITFGIFIYLFLFYNMSLNVMRQLVAVAFVLLAVSYYLKNMKIDKITIASIGGAFLSHKTGFFGLANIILMKFNSKEVRKIIYIVTPAIIISFSAIANFLLSKFEFAYWISGYIESILRRDGDWFLNVLKPYYIVWMLWRWLFTYIIWLFIKKHPKFRCNENVINLFSLYFIGVYVHFFLFYVIQSAFVNRWTVYLEAVQIILLAVIMKNMRTNNIYKIALIILVIFNWVTFTMYGNDFGTSVFNFR